MKKEKKDQKNNVPSLVQYNFSDEEKIVWDKVKADYALDRGILSNIKENNRTDNNKSNIQDKDQDTVSFVEEFDSLQSVEMFDKFNDVLEERVAVLTEKNEKLKEEENRWAAGFNSVNEKLQDINNKTVSIQQQEKNQKYKASTVDDEISQVEAQIDFEERLYKKYKEQLNGAEQVFFNIKNEISREEIQLKVLKKRNVVKIESVKQQQKELCSLISLTMKRLSPEIANMGDDYSILTEISRDKITKTDEILLIGKKLGIIPTDKGDLDIDGDPNIDDAIKEDELSELNLWNLKEILGNIQENMKKTESAEPDDFHD